LGSWSFPQFVASKARDLEPPSSCSWKTKEVGASFQLQLENKEVGVSNEYNS